MKMSPLDFLFLSMETVENPAHVASLGIYEIPDGYAGNFVRDLRDRLLAQTEISRPFNLRVKPQRILPGWYEWEVDANLDLRFHVRHSSLPKPGTMEDLMDLVSRLHARLLDRSRPLWECYLIEGLKGNRFAVYIKMHHCTIDGAGGMEMIENGLSMVPDRDEVVAWWNLSRKPAAAREWPGLQRLMLSLPSSVLRQALAIPQAAYAILAPSFGLKKTEAGKAFRGGKSMFNRNISASRSFGIGSLSLGEVKAAGAILGATVNDIFLSACAGALRKYMTQKGDPPGKDFSAAVPVAMSREGGNNAIAYILVALHTDITNPVERVSAVSRSAKGAKHDQAHLSRAVINTMTLMAQGMQAALGRIGLSEVVPPAAGLVISNVPGMRQPRYLMGAKMTSLYPMSVLIHAQGLNITVLSYADELQYGLLSTPEIAPDVQHLADLVGKEFRIIRAAANKLENKRIAVQHATASQKRKKVARKKVTRKPQPARA